MDNYTVEYLSVISSRETFCRSIPSFNNLLQSNDNIKINKNNLNFKGIQFGYDVQFNEILENEQRFFHIKLSSKKTNLKEFKLLLKSVRTLLAQASGGTPPEILWNDISSELAQKAYPMIHELENIMRKLITKFMLTNIGLTWTKDAIPKEVTESVRNKKTRFNQNYLFEVDFIQLSNLLFKEYSTTNVRILIDKLEKAEDISELNLSELKEFIPLSNWERYFSPFVKCNSDYLKARWERLYELRCIVAHNKPINTFEYEEICKLSKEVKEKLIQAIDNLEKVDISHEQKEDVAENFASNINTLYGDYITSWKMLEEVIFHLYSLVNDVDETDINRKNFSLRFMIQQLVSDDIIPKEFDRAIKELYSIRNEIVHTSDLSISESELSDFLVYLEDTRDDIISIIAKHEHAAPYAIRFDQSGYEIMD